MQPDLLGAATQRLIDLGLSGVVILALAYAFLRLWDQREKDRTRADERYEAVQEKRIAEQASALDAVGKAVDTVETTIETLTRSHQQ